MLFTIAKPDDGADETGTAWTYRTALSVFHLHLLRFDRVCGCVLLYFITADDSRNTIIVYWVPRIFPGSFEAS